MQARVAGLAGEPSTCKEGDSLTDKLAKLPDIRYAGAILSYDEVTTFMREESSSWIKMRR